MKKLAGCLSIVLALTLLALPAEAQVGYGSAVAVGDEEVFIGEPGNRMTSGFVYVYRPGSDGWEEVLELARPGATAGDRFGQAIAVGDELLLVSATRADNGAVYVFRREGDQWVASGSFAATGLTEDDGFGSSLAMDGDLVIVGSPGTSEGEGTAYVFRRQGATWAQVARLEPDEESVAEEAAGGGRGGQAAGGGEAEEGDEQDQQRRFPARFGSAVAIAGNVALVGAPGAAQRGGQVYIFERGAEGWQKVTVLPGDEGERGAGFGSTLGFHDGEIFIGAAGANAGLGAVYVYGWDGDDEEWAMSSSLVAFDAIRGHSFGSAFAFDGDDLLVGAPGAAGSEGRIYRFARDREGNWTGATKMASEGIESRDRFASTLAAAGDVVVAGVARDDYGAGSAIIMTRTDWGWERSKVLSDIKGFEPITGAAVPCADGTAAHWGCEGVELISYLPVHAIGGARGVRTNDIWGWTDPETGREYAIVGLTDQASFVDVTDPLNPVYVGRLPKTEGARASTWRDIKVYRDHAFIVSDGAGEHGVQVFDLKRLRGFAGEPVTFSEDAHYDGIHSTHNIVINEETGFAYAVGASGGGETCGGGLHMINIEDPKRPVFAGCFSDPSTGRRGTGYSHDAQCVAYHGPDERYQGREICFGANETALSVADVTDKNSPVAVGMATYPNVGYTHQGWLTPDHKYFFMNDELDEIQDKVPGTRTLIWDVQELDDPILVREYVSENPATDHNLYVLGNLMFQSNYDSGLRVYDVSDPENPRPEAYFDTVPYGPDGQGMSGSWSNYPYFRHRIVAVTSGNEGLFLVKVPALVDSRPDGRD